MVRKIEDSLKNAKGPRIQIIKSRQIKNARSFAEKVFRVLKLHGYRIQPLNVENIKQKPDSSETGPQTIYTIDEPTIKDILGEAIDESERPIRALFDHSMLAYMRAPVLIVVVSDEFYGETGLHDYAQGISQEKRPATPKKRKRTGDEKNLATPISLYLAAVAFLVSGINSVFGSYFVAFTSLGSLNMLPTTILLISIAAIVGRAVSLGKESIRSIQVVVPSILLFIILTLLGIFIGDLPTSLANALNNSQFSLFSQPLSVLELSIAIAFFVIAMLRYVLFLGRDSGAPAYALTIFGIVWITFIVELSLFHPFTAPLLTSSTGGIQTVNAALPTDFPVFAFNYYVSFPGVAQYMIPINLLALIGNLMMATGLLLAAKAQRALWSGHKKATVENKGMSA